MFYRVVRKPASIRFDEVALFFIFDMRHYGIKTSEYIYVIMQQPKENSNVIDKVSSTVFPQLKGGALEYSNRHVECESKGFTGAVEL
ncbi:hypothetical protein [Chryseobacterium jejuense]|uniref:hypothetical protein n=1 Tax=Chryseobacterium jejuense TaxID=445960 RepID=UPI001AE12F5F|nr:hypothetical protein [Chryseobacterium jejuense]MBP2615649.1 hypothetical protein [Chryseobacterium jejuense]